MMVIVTDDDNNDYDDGDSDKYEKLIVQIGLGADTLMESDTRFFRFHVIIFMLSSSSSSP